VILRLLLQRGSFTAGKLHVTECFRLLRQGLPYFWATASNLLALQLDKIIVVSLMSAEAAGIYTVAVTFSCAQSSWVRRWALLPLRSSPTQKASIGKAKFSRKHSARHSLLPRALGLVLSCFVPASHWAIVRPRVRSSGAARGHFDGLGCAYDAGRHLIQGLKARDALPRSRSQLLGTGVLAGSASLLLLRNSD